MDCGQLKAARSYVDESQRLSLCRGLVSCSVPPALAVEHDLPVSNLRGSCGLVDIDVEALKLARDVSAN